MGIAICLLVWFRRRFDHQGKLAKAVSASAYAAVILHASSLILVALGLTHVELFRLLKFALAALISLPACFIVGGIVRRFSQAQRIL